MKQLPIFEIHMTETILPFTISTIDRETLKHYCHISHNADDNLLDRLLLFALTSLEVQFDFTIRKRRIQKTLYDLPARGFITINRKPICKIDYLCIFYEQHKQDINNINDYAYIDNAQEPAIHIFNVEKFKQRIGNFLSMQWGINVGLAETIQELPEDLKQAVFMLVSYYYDNRCAQAYRTHAIPRAVLTLMQPYKRYRLYDSV